MGETIAIVRVADDDLVQAVLAFLVLILTQANRDVLVGRDVDGAMRDGFVIDGLRLHIAASRSVQLDFGDPHRAQRAVMQVQADRGAGIARAIGFDAHLDLRHRRPIVRAVRAVDEASVRRFDLGIPTVADVHIHRDQGGRVVAALDAVDHLRIRIEHGVVEAGGIGLPLGLLPVDGSAHGLSRHVVLGILQQDNREFVQGADQRRRRSRLVNDYVGQTRVARRRIGDCAENLHVERLCQRGVVRLVRHLRHEGCLHEVSVAEVAVVVLRAGAERDAFHGGIPDPLAAHLLSVDADDLQALDHVVGRLSLSRGLAVWIRAQQFAVAQLLQRESALVQLQRPGLNGEGQVLVCRGVIRPRGVRRVLQAQVHRVIAGVRAAAVAHHGVEPVVLVDVRLLQLAVVLDGLDLGNRHHAGRHGDGDLRGEGQVQIRQIRLEDEVERVIANRIQHDVRGLPYQLAREGVHIPVRPVGIHVRRDTVEIPGRRARMQQGLVVDVAQPRAGLDRDGNHPFLINVFAPRLRGHDLDVLAGLLADEVVLVVPHHAVIEIPVNRFATVREIQDGDLAAIAFVQRDRGRSRHPRRQRQVIRTGVHAIGSGDGQMLIQPVARIDVDHVDHAVFQLAL